MLCVSKPWRNDRCKRCTNWQGLLKDSHEVVYNLFRGCNRKSSVRSKIRVCIHVVWIHIVTSLEFGQIPAVRRGFNTDSWRTLSQNSPEDCRVVLRMNT